MNGKGIYCLKIMLFNKQFKLNIEEKKPCKPFHCLIENATLKLGLLL